MASAEPIEHMVPDWNMLAHTLALAWTALVAGVLFWLFRDYGYDDPYITYRYAANLAEGIGFVYNAGERVLSTTTPLYTLLLALLRLAGADIPLASNAIASASLAMGGLAFWQLGVAWSERWVGAIGLLLYPLFPLLITTIGAETAFAIMLILFGFLGYARQRYVLAAMLLGLATLVRADAILAALVLGGHMVLERPRQLPWHALLVYCLMIAPGLLFAWLYFGAPLPATLAAKRQQGTMAISQGFFAGLLSQVRDNYWRYPIYRPMFVCSALGLVAGLARPQRWWLLVSWGALYAAAYSALGVTSYFWYYGPVVPGFVALVGLGAAGIRQLLARAIGPRWAFGAAAALAIGLLYPQLQALSYLTAHPDTRLPSYRAAGEWLRKHTPPDASVGALEVGIIGYYAQRRMIDFAGLLQPDVAKMLTPASTYDDAALWAIKRYKPNYLVLRPEALPRTVHEGSVARRCHSVQSFSDPAFVSPLVIYACK